MFTPLPRRNLLVGMLGIPALAVPRRPPHERRGEKDAVRADVLVVGAGASGIPAAIAAARSGARVILLEEDSVPGGAPVDMYVAMLCGGPRLGIFLEMANRLNQKHDLTGHPIAPFPNGGLDNRDHWYLPSSYLQVLTEMMAAEQNLTVICGARAIGATVSAAGDRTRVRGVAVEGPGGKPRYYEAPVTIDATGAGFVAALAGCETRYGRNARSQFNEPYGPDAPDQVVQRCTWMYVSQRVRPGAVLPRDLIGGGLVESNVGWIQKGDQAAAHRNTGIYLHWGATVNCEDTRDPESLARAQREALQELNRDMAVLMEHGYVMHLAPRLGVRECRRVMGEHVVTVNDIKSGKLPDDVIALSDYGLDAWGEKLTREQIDCPRSGIPYRALIPKKTEGLLIAGKSISGTHLAASSYRVQPIVASIGAAAGIAAASAARNKTGVRSLSVADLQRRLKQMGVLVWEGLRADG